MKSEGHFKGLHGIQIQLVPTGCAVAGDDVWHFYVRVRPLRCPDMYISDPGGFQRAIITCKLPLESLVCFAFMKII